MIMQLCFRLMKVMPAFVLAIALFAAHPDHSLPAQPIRLSSGPQLFIDEYLIAESNGLVRTTHQPEKVLRPVLGKAESWHRQPQWSLKVIYYPGSTLYRMWYNVKNPGGAPEWCYALAESQDGIKWDRPEWGLVEVGGSRKNNLIAAPLGHFSLFLVDEGADYRDAARRYKMAYGGGGLCLAFSADGLNFKEYKGNPVIHEYAGHAKANQPGYKSVIDDVIDGCWDPLRKQYLIAAKRWDCGYPGKPKNAPDGMRRTVILTTSKDFVNWKTPEQIIKPDPKNGLEEFYGMQPMVRGNLYIGFLRVLRDDLPADDGGDVNGIGWTELITSRDGEHWNRNQKVFIDRNHKSDTWDHAMAWVGDCVTVGNEDYIYYCGYSSGHKVGDRQVGLARLRKNGFVSYDADAKWGNLRTPPLLLSCKRMTVNAEVEGELRARLLDLQGKPIPGFDADDCGPLRGNSVAHPINWHGNLSNLADEPVRIEFLLRNTRLFAFSLEE